MLTGFKNRAASAIAKDTKNEIRESLNYETADCALRYNAIKIAERRIWLLTPWGH